MNAQELFDVTIIGGGPAGLYSAFYSGLRKMKTKLIEFQPYLGGKIHVYPEKMIWDIGGVTPIRGAALIDQIVQQGLTFDPAVFLNEKVVSITRNEDGIFELQCSSGCIHYSKTIIVAIGSGILKPQKLQIDGAQAYEVSNLSYTIQSLQHFKNKTVLLSGGGDSAIDWANELLPIAKKVIVTYRKDSFSGHEAQVEKLLHSSAICYFQTSITNLIANAEDQSIEKVELTNTATNEVTIVDVDEVVVNHGFERDAALLAESPLPIKLVNETTIEGTPNGESSIPGLFAAGDILSHEGKLHLIAGAFQDAANAVNKAKKYIHPDAEGYGMVSSHNEVFQKRNKELMMKMT